MLLYSWMILVFTYVELFNKTQTRVKNMSMSRFEVWVPDISYD